MTYHPERDMGYRWEMAKIRHDKTERFQMGKLYRTANSIITANNIWKNIHAPISSSMLKTGDGIPTPIEEDSSIENMMIYYNRIKRREETRTKNMLDFHNIYIKSEILIKSVVKMGVSVLDIACGKASDMLKFKYFGAGFVFGIDISKDNIYNPRDGAWARYINILRKEKCDAEFKRCPIMVFAKADATKNIRGMEGITDPLDKSIINSVYGMGTKTETDSGAPLLAKINGIGAGGFDVVTCMFAIHYFFQSEVHLNSFLRNLAENTREGSYFIGCCFDGDKVFSRLRSFGKDEFLTRSDSDGELVWQIQKLYDDETFPASKASLGMSINVYIETINNRFKEYLVNFDYLTERLGEIGFRPITDKEARELGLPGSSKNFEDSFNSMTITHERYGTSQDMMPLEKELSFMNRWFIFKRASR